MDLFVRSKRKESFQTVKIYPLFIVQICSHLYKRKNQSEMNDFKKFINVFVNFQN